MKFSSSHQTGSRRTGASAFTLVEMLFAMGIFSAVIAAMCATQLFGLRVYTLAATKLSATAGCRKALNAVRDQIRQANQVNIGNCPGDYTTFNWLGITNNQVGNAVKVFPFVSYVPNADWDTNNFILFYLDYTGGTNWLKQYTHTVTATMTATTTNYATNIAIVTLAGYITNLDVFAAQDYAGTILTNEDQLDAIDNRLVVYMKLQFYQWEYPIAFVGTNSGYGNMYDFYQLRTKITRRSMVGFTSP